MTEQSTHGLVQSQALTATAIRLSEERARHATVEENVREGYMVSAVLGPSLVRVRDAEVQYEEAYRRYTNPFNVEKTVDARWPNVPK